MEVTVARALVEVFLPLLFGSGLAAAFVIGFVIGRR